MDAIKSMVEEADMYYKTTILVEIISDRLIPPGMDLQDIAREMTEGYYSGVWDVVNVTELSVESCAKALEAQGSDPEFLLGDDWSAEEEEG